MKKVVINSCYGGFSLSKKAMERLEELGVKDEFYEENKNDPALDDDDMWRPNVKRSDPRLVQVVEELGDEASGACAELEVVEVDGKYRITEYDGWESIETPDDIEWEE